MTEKLVNVAVFWLPLFAGIILSGLGPSIWYGGDKIVALWVSFVGIVFLLLTAAIQVQSYIQATILQPQFEILPQQKSRLTWGEGPYPNLFNVRGENDQLPAGGWKVPAFTIKNSTPINAQDVRIKWSAPKYDMATIAGTAAIFQGERQIHFDNDKFTLSGPPGAPNGQNGIAFSATLEKPFITRSAETFIPLDVWDSAALFFVSTTPPQLGAKSEPYYFDVQIEWSIPENSRPSKFRVKAVATNTKPRRPIRRYFLQKLNFSSRRTASEPPAKSGAPERQLRIHDETAAGAEGIMKTQD
jgi:hypothetical protein